MLLGKETNTSACEHFIQVSEHSLLVKIKVAEM